MSYLKTLNDIPTLSLLYKLQRLHPAASTLPKATSAFNDKISLIRTDITQLKVDAIVNAANEGLLGGGGVDGAIHRAAGRRLYNECRTLNGCDTGDAKITDGYNLPCRKVIHTPGPIYGSYKTEDKHTSLLQSCYRTCLDLAAENGCKSIAFSALSTGVYGYPSGEAAETAIGEVKRWLEEDDDRAAKLERIIFCSFMEKDEKAYDEWIPKFFPPADKVAEHQTAPNEGDKVEQTETTEGSNLPIFPDAPTKEPAEKGQPETKKLKTDHEPTDDFELVDKDDVQKRMADEGGALSKKVGDKTEDVGHETEQIGDAGAEKKSEGSIIKDVE